MARGSDGTVTLNFEADIRQLQAKLDVINDSIQNMSGQSQQNFKSVGFRVMEFNQALELAQKAVRVLKAALSKPIETTAEFEALRQRVENLYGEVDRGREAFAAFADQAAKTPFSLQKVVEAGAQLKAFGLNAEKTLSSAADLAAFMGVDIVQAANAMGRAFAGGVGAADILRERGVLNLIKEFKGIDDLTKLTLPEFRQAMLDTFISPSANIAGSADKMAETYQGAVSNMQDALDQLYNAIGERFLPVMKNGTKNVTEFANSLKNFIELKADEKIRMQQQEFQILALTLQDVNTSESTREEILNRLQTEYPDYLENISLEGDYHNGLKDALENVNKEFERKILLTAAQQVLNEKYEKVVRAQVKLFEAELALRDPQKIADATAGMVAGMGAGITGLQNDVTRAKNGLIEVQNEYKKIYDGILEQGLEIDTNRKVIDNTVKRQKEQKTVVQETTEETKVSTAELLRQAQIEQQIQQILFNRKSLKEQIQILEQELNTLKGKGGEISRDEYLLMLKKEDQLNTLRENHERINTIQDSLTKAQSDNLDFARDISGVFGDMVINAKNMDEILVNTAKRFAQQIAADLFYYLVWLAVTGGTGSFAAGPAFNVLGQGLKSLGINLPGFAQGGSFTIPGAGAPDSKVVMFKGSPGEQVTVTTPGQQMDSAVVERLDRILGLIERGGNLKLAGNDFEVFLNKLEKSKL